MMRLLRIEWHKIGANRTFKVLSIIYLIVIMVISMGVMPFLRYVTRKFADNDFGEVDFTMLPFYEFPDIWQNLTYVAIYFKIFLALSLVYAITNEYTYRTIRQNVIDGLSKHEFIWSKIVMAGFLSLISTLTLFVFGMFTGLLYSYDTSLSVIFEDIYFLGVFFLQLFTYLLFVMMLATLVKKPLLTMALMFFIAVVEGIIFGRSMAFDFPWVQDFLPLTTINKLNSVPFPKYVFQEIQDYVKLKELILVLVYGGLFYLGTVRLTVRRDL
ncbi:MAG: ABC transporter permease [Roseivirga sp.]|nr:ABC transporter permease [Roseivirga sp.]